MGGVELVVFADEAHCAAVYTLGTLNVIGKSCAGWGVLDFAEVPGVDAELDEGSGDFFGAVGGDDEGLAEAEVPGAFNGFEREVAPASEDLEDLLRGPGGAVNVEGDALWENSGEVGSDATTSDVAHGVHGGAEVAFEKRV
ncbi:MAG: hypothetical protein RLZZ90_688 [Actinomycetota bacterium]